MAGHSVEEIKKETRVYRNVFLALGVFTIITVAIAQLDVSTGTAIALALFIATIKGSLVACYFMHLISERKLVYSVLVLTAIFFVALIVLPLGSYFGSTAGA
jgi:cytochrome c oxidase subunit 4